MISKPPKWDPGRLRYLHTVRDESAAASIDVFWGACHGGQLQAAQFLLDQGADVDWIPGWENLTPLEAAIRSNATEVVDWLRERGAKTATELGR
jgi:ankyrin repeat protein